MIILFAAAFAAQAAPSAAPCPTVLTQAAQSCRAVEASKAGRFAEAATAFESAADLYGRALLAIVLTGGNEDGAAGALAVRRAGGVVVVQAPGEARAPEMPAAALARVPDAHVLDLAAIGALLHEIEFEEAR